MTVTAIDQTITVQLESDAARCRAAGIPFNPRLPRDFANTPNDRRPATHHRWWYRPYIETYTSSPAEPGHEKWIEHWPAGIRYDVRCLDGGAWDRPTCWGMFATLHEAIHCAQSRKEFA